MGVETDRVSALACVPSAIPAAERATHFVLARKLFTGLARERTELADGYAVRFEPDAFEAVVRFVANERKCCPFLTFDLVVAPESGPLWLRIRGPEGARAVLQAQWDLTRPCSGDDRIEAWADRPTRQLPTNYHTVLYSTE